MSRVNLKLSYLVSLQGVPTVGRPLDMPNILEATDALRTALNKQRVESHVHDAFNNLTPCLVLLVCMRELF